MTCNRSSPRVPRHVCNAACPTAVPPPGADEAGALAAGDADGAMDGDAGTALAGVGVVGAGWPIDAVADGGTTDAALGPAC
jgi:hypothetical protein